MLLKRVYPIEKKFWPQDCRWLYEYNLMEEQAWTNAENNASEKNTQICFFPGRDKTPIWFMYITNAVQLLMVGSTKKTALLKQKSSFQISLLCLCVNVGQFSLFTVCPLHTQTSILYVFMEPSNLHRWPNSSQNFKASIWSGKIKSFPLPWAFHIFERQNVFKVTRFGTIYS